MAENEQDTQAYVDAAGDMRYALKKLDDALDDIQKRRGNSAEALAAKEAHFETMYRDFSRAFDRHVDPKTQKLRPHRSESIWRLHDFKSRQGAMASGMSGSLNATAATDAMDEATRAAQERHFPGSTKLSSTSASAVFLSATESTPVLEKQSVENGFASYEYWREVAYPFRGQHTLTGQSLDFPESRIRHWYETDKLMLAADFRIPLNDNHNVCSATAGLGNVIDFRLDNSGTLYAKFKIIGEANRDIFLNNALSVTIEPEAKDSNGNVWHDVITSIASTQRGQLGGMGDAIAASAIGSVNKTDAVGRIIASIPGDVNEPTRAAIRRMHGMR